MLRQEKGGQEAIYMQKSIGCDRDFIRRGSERAALTQLLISGSELVEDIHPEFGSEVTGIEPARLELKNHLTNEPLPRLHRERPAQRQSPFLKHANVLLPAVHI